MATAKNPILDSVRIIPRDSAFLTRKVGSRGEIFFDDDTNTLRLYDGVNAGGIPLLRADLENIDGVIGAALGETAPVGVQPGTLWFNTANGRLYVYYSDGTSSQWVQPQSPLYGGGGGGGGAEELNELTDVVITSPASGQILKYNGTNWANSAEINTTYNISAETVLNGSILRLAGSDLSNDDISILGGTYASVSRTDANIISIEGTGYNVSSVTNDAGVALRLSSTRGTTDDVNILAGANMTVTRTDENTITLAASTSAVTYAIDTGITTGGANLVLSGSTGSTDFVKFASGTNVTVARTDANTITISSSGGSSTGNVTFSGNILDSADSSALVFAPAVTFNSDITVENEIICNNTIRASSFETTSVGITELFSETILNLRAAVAVVVSDAPLRLPRMTTATRDSFIAQNGDVIYNTSTNKFQGYENGSWVNLV